MWNQTSGGGGCGNGGGDGGRWSRRYEEQKKNLMAELPVPGHLSEAFKDFLLKPGILPDGIGCWNSRLDDLYHLNFSKQNF